MNETEQKFLHELEELLQKWGVSIEIEEIGRNFCNRDYVINFFAYTKFDKDGNQIQEKINFSKKYLGEI